MAKPEVSSLVNEVSRISAGAEVKGNLIAQSDIRIDGIFEGDLVTSGKLVLGEHAVLRGNIICSSADIWGKVEGDFCTKDSITFKNTASFTGNLKTLKICIEMGTEFSGNCEIITEEEFATMSAEYFK